jgi:uncharacterized protein YrrD
MTFNSTSTYKAKDIINKSVISLNSGTINHHVKDILFNYSANTVLALIIDEGWFSGAKIIEIKNIYSIGEDAITISDNSYIVDNKLFSTSLTNSIENDLEAPFTSLNNDHYIIGKDVITQDGKNLGSVTDIHFSAPDGKILYYELSKGIVSNIIQSKSNPDLLPIDNIVVIGDENIIVTNNSLLDDQELDGEDLLEEMV